MIHKPPQSFGRRSPAVERVRSVAASATEVGRVGSTVVRSGTYALRGAVCWAFAILWGFAAFGAGMAAGLPTFIGVGAMAAGMGWMGTRMFRKGGILRG